MTRETKIGLLVGLAFIIVVGILLSEHLTTTTERPAAPLADAGEGVREGVAAPGVTMRDETAPYRAPEPASPVPVARDLAVQPPVQPAQVAVGPAGQVQPPIVITNTPTAAPVIPAIENGTQTPVTPVGNDPLVTRLPTDIFANQHPIQNLAAQQGEPLVPVNNSNNNTNNSTTLAANKVREYTAQPGDTLSRIASLLNGGNTKANRDAVMALNPELKKDPNKVIAGRKYQLPIDSAAVAPVPAPAPVVQTPSPVVRTPDRPADTQYRIYVVKKGDNLTKIAIEQLGSKSHLPVIRELNKDVLKGGDVIKIDMKLKLPAKTVAASD